MPRLEKGEHCPLNVTKKAEHRVLAGLGWEPHAHAGMLEKLGAAMGLKSINHDLDLACLTFDEHRNLLGTISPAVGAPTDRSGRIYHSGDNVAGEGDGDDEQVSVELLKLDPSIHYIMFVATIKSGHTFGEIDSPEIRLADGYSNHNFLITPLTHLEGKAKSAFAFASIYRKEEGWNIHNISTYIDVTVLQKPNGALSTLLTKA